jgi:hypothetical protein
LEGGLYDPLTGDVYMTGGGDVLGVDDPDLDPDKAGWIHIDGDDLGPDTATWRTSRTALLSRPTETARRTMEIQAHHGDSGRSTDPGAARPEGSGHSRLQCGPFATLFLNFRGHAEDVVRQRNGQAEEETNPYEEKLLADLDAGMNSAPPR